MSVNAPLDACVYVCSIMSNYSVSPWTITHQDPLSMAFPRQTYWSGLSFPPPGDLLKLGIKTESLTSPALQADSLQLSHLGSPPPVDKSKLKTKNKTDKRKTPTV